MLQKHQIVKKLDLNWIIFHTRILTSKILGYGRGVCHFNLLPNRTSMIYHLSCYHLFLRFLVPPFNNMFNLHIIFHQSNFTKMVVLHNRLARYGDGWLLSQAQKQPRHKNFWRTWINHDKNKPNLKSKHGTQKLNIKTQSVQDLNSNVTLCW
jgi:hypothetical protein